MSNSVGTDNIGTLLRKFAIPSIIAMIVGALYNIVDQFFIGQSIGELGNAATNVAFPVTTCCVGLSLMIGVGSASAFNLAMGRGENKKALFFVGNGVSLLLGTGFALFLVTELFLEPILLLCGSPEEVLPYAKEYLSITALGFPFFMLSSGGSHLVRADGRPK